MPFCKFQFEDCVVFLEINDLVSDLFFQIGFNFYLFVRIKQQIGFFNIIENAH